MAPDNRHFQRVKTVDDNGSTRKPQKPELGGRKREIVKRFWLGGGEDD